MNIVIKIGMSLQFPLLIGVLLELLGFLPDKRLLLPLAIIWCVGFLMGIFGSQ